MGVPYLSMNARKKTKTGNIAFYWLYVPNFPYHTGFLWLPSTHFLHGNIWRVWVPSWSCSPWQVGCPASHHGSGSQRLLLLGGEDQHLQSEPQGVVPLQQGGEVAHGPPSGKTSSFGSPILHHRSTAGSSGMAASVAVDLFHLDCWYGLLLDLKVDVDC